MAEEVVKDEDEGVSQVWTLDCSQVSGGVLNTEKKLDSRQMNVTSRILMRFKEVFIGSAHQRSLLSEDECAGGWLVLKELILSPICLFIDHLLTKKQLQRKKLTVFMGTQSSFFSLTVSV